MTSYHGVRRAQNRQEIDRRTWAELERVRFNLQVTGAGEYLMEEPIMFGQAFEEPPFFTWSGVGEGEVFPEVKAIGWPVGEPCAGEPVYGANILRDPNFSNLDEVPTNQGNNWSTVLDWVGTEAPFSQVGWQSYSNPGDWVVSTANPRVGTKHLRTNVTAQHCYAVGGEFCGVAVDWEPTIPSAFVAAGDTVTFRIYAMTSATATIQMVIDPADIEGSLDGADSVASSFGLSGTYEQKTVSLVIPALAGSTGLPVGSVQVGFRVTARTGTVDVANCQLEVEAA